MTILILIKYLSSYWS